MFGAGRRLIVLVVRDRAQTSGKAAKEDDMGLFDRFRKPKDTGQVSMDGGGRRTFR